MKLNTLLVLLLVLGFAELAVIASLVLTIENPLHPKYSDRWVVKSINEYGVTEYQPQPMSPEDITKAETASAQEQAIIDAGIIQRAAS